jgi:hypothetical protein
MNYTYGSPNGYEQILYSWDLGKKEGNLYSGKKWSEVLLNGVPVDTILDLELQDKFIDYKNQIEQTNNNTMINDRNVDPKIMISESSLHLENTMYERHFRRRKIPQKKSKNYPQKPLSKNIQKEHKEVSFSNDIKFYESKMSRL